MPEAIALLRAKKIGKTPVALKVVWGVRKNLWEATFNSESGYRRLRLWATGS